MPTLATMPTKRPLTAMGGFTNLGGPPTAPTPLQAPNLPPSPTAPPLSAPTIGTAPTPTPYGSFTPPSLPDGMDPYQWRVDQANKGAQRSAAARGTLLSGGFQASLAKLNQGLASEEAGNIYGRARDTYALNRDTNQQNFGQQMAGFGATLDAGRFKLAGDTAVYDRAYGAGRDAYGDLRDVARDQANTTNANAGASDDFSRQMSDYNAAIAAQRAAASQQQVNAEAAMRRPMAQQPGSRPGYRRAMPGSR